LRSDTLLFQIICLDCYIAQQESKICGENGAGGESFRRRVTGRESALAFISAGKALRFAREANLCLKNIASDTVETESGALRNTRVRFMNAGIPVRSITSINGRKRTVTAQ